MQVSIWRNKSGHLSATTRTTSTGTRNTRAQRNKGKGKSSYDKWSNEEQSFLVDPWAEKHHCLESKEARIAWQEICQEIKINFGTKKTVDKCKRKIKYLSNKWKDAENWNKTQLRKSVFCDKIFHVLGTRDVVTLEGPLSTIMHCAHEQWNQPFLMPSLFWNFSYHFEIALHQRK